MRRALIGASVCVALASAPSATARPPLHKLPTTSPVFGDGHTQLAWQEGASVRLLKDGQAWTAARSFAAPTRCPLAAAGVTRLAFECRDSQGAVRPMLLDPATGTTATPPGTDALVDDQRQNMANSETYFLEEVGTQLLRIRVTGVHVDSNLFFDWQEGRLLSGIDLTSRTIRTLDTPSGSMGLCSPLRVTTHPDPDSEERVFDDTLFASPRLVIVHGSRLRLLRCGSRRARVFRSSSLYGVILTSRYLAWTSATRLNVWLFRGRRLLGWRLPHTQPDAFGGTDETVVVGFPNSPSSWAVDLSPRPR